MHHPTTMASMFRSFDHNSYAGAKGLLIKKTSPVIGPFCYFLVMFPQPYAPPLSVHFFCSKVKTYG